MRSPDRERPSLYTIGEAARWLGVSVATIRLYEREGLVIPVRKPSGHRLFSETDIQRLHCIRETITTDKVSIAGLRRMLALIPCWTIKNCPPAERDACPAFRHHTTPCWSLPDRKWDCADSDCRTCRVYCSIADCGGLKEMIINLTTKSS